jgi:hypothetical protein
VVTIVTEKAFASKHFVSLFETEELIASIITEWVFLAKVVQGVFGMLTGVKV